MVAVRWESVCRKDELPLATLPLALPGNTVTLAWRRDVIRPYDELRELLVMINV